MRPREASQPMSSRAEDEAAEPTVAAPRMLRPVADVPDCE